MRFKEISATFGKLQNAKLVLESGLNCIYAPNESGKTTWARFICNIMYGVNTRDRNPLADKTRYQPWSGGTMQGSVTLEAQGKSYTLQRTTKRANAPMGVFSCVYTDTAEETADFSAADAGEMLLGVPREVYERSAFIGQNALAVEQDAELERRIAALITTGEEDTSFSESYERLKKQLNRRRHNRTGQIPVLEGEIADLQHRLENIDSYSAEAEYSQQQLEHANSRLQDLQEQQALWQQLEAQNLYRQSLHQRQDANAKLQELQDKVAAAHAAANAHPLHGVDDNTLQEKFHPAPPKKPLPFWLPIAASILVFILGILLQILHLIKLPQWVSIACAGLSVLFAVFAVITLRKHQSYHATLVKQSAAVDTLRQQVNEYRLLQQAVQSNEDSLIQYRILYDSLPQIQSVPLTDLPTPSLSAEQIAWQIPIVKEDIVRLRSRLDTLTGQLQSLGSVDTICTQLSHKQETLTALQTQYDAISLAMEALTDANTVLQNRFSPALGKRASEIFGKITGGRYEKVLLNRDFAISAEAQGDPVMHSLSLLSQGTADQLYLAVRLAICDMVLPAENNPPLILDDALLSFDEERLHAALDYLAEAGKHRQILLFSCQKRERDYLWGRENVSFLELKSE